MVVLPAVPPVTIPVAISAVAMVGFALVQVPPVVVFASVVVDKEQITDVPVIEAGSGWMVMVAEVLPQPVV
jgi:hypothetical protein